MRRYQISREVYINGVAEVTLVIRSVTTRWRLLLIATLADLCVDRLQANPTLWTASDLMTLSNFKAANRIACIIGASNKGRHDGQSNRCSSIRSILNDGVLFVAICSMALSDRWLTLAPPNAVCSPSSVSSAAPPASSRPFPSISGPVVSATEGQSRRDRCQLPVVPGVRWPAPPFPFRFSIVEWSRLNP